MSLYSISISLLILSVYSCSNAQKSSYNQAETNDSVINNLAFSDNKSEQEKALDALNDIQMSGGGKLYSTFANIAHSECRGAIENYAISNAEFENALLELLDENYRDLSKEQREYLASTSAKAQKEYQLTTCGSTDPLTDTTMSSEPPRNGTWIFPAILDQRDLTIIW